MLVYIYILTFIKKSKNSYAAAHTNVYLEPKNLEFPNYPATFPQACAKGNRIILTLIFISGKYLFLKYLFIGSLRSLCLPP